MGKKVRFIVYSDLHLEEWKRFNKDNQRLEYGLDVIKRIRKRAKFLKCPILFGGDLYHKENGLSNSIMENTLPQLSKLFRTRKPMTYAITGNHDQSQENSIERESPSYIKTLSSLFKGLECIDFKKKEFDDCAVYGVPYLTHDIGLLDYVRSLELDHSIVNILMLHTTMPGASDTDGRTVNSHFARDEFLDTVSRFDIVLSGHIHAPDHGKHSKADIIQIGAPQQQRLTDRDCEMGFWQIYDNFEVEFIPFKKYPKFIELEPGEEPTDDFNYFVTKPEKRQKGYEEKSTDAKKDYSDVENPTKLGKRYLREKKIKDKDKKRLLFNLLKKTQ